jgi:predicted AAA+ superfamily ATPase
VATVVRRNAQELVTGALERFPVVAIQGARRVGKSTLAGAVVAGRPHVIVSLDDAEQRTLALDDPRGFLAQRGERTMVIDEVQRVPDLLLAIKAEVDRLGQPGRFVLTGSSDFTTLPHIPDSLAGRAVTIALGGLSMGEIDGVHEDFATWVRSGLPAKPVPTSGWTRADYIDAIVAGGYPELRPLDEPWRTLWADSYIDRLTSRDVQDVAERVAAQRLRAVLGLIAQNQSGELVKARLAAAAGISERSVTTCVDALRALYVVTAIPAWSAGVTKRQVGRTKALVLDSGLAAHLAGVEPDWLKEHLGANALGPLLEGFVLAELLKQRVWSASRWELAHFRDRAGLETDAIIRFADGRVILLEVKASQTYRSEYFAAMRRLADGMGDRLVAGIVLTMSDHGYRYAENLWGLPISALWTGGSVASGIGSDADQASPGVYDIESDGFQIPGA